MKQRRLHALGALAQFRLRRIGIFLAALGILVTCVMRTSANPPSPSRSPSPSLGVNQTVRVTVQPDQPNRAIPANFLGFSYEVSTLKSSSLKAQNAVLVQLLKNLGSGVLRFGGSEVDRTRWDADGTQTARNAPINRADLERMFELAKTANWRVLLGVNLKQNDSAAAAEQAAIAAQLGGNTLLGVEIGNEPDLYYRTMPGWGYPQYLERYRAYVQAIRARVPNIPIAGPGISGQKWLPDFVRDEGDRLALVTQHLYPLTRCNIRQGAPTGSFSEWATKLLSQRAMQATIAQVDRAAGIAQQANLPLWLGETNSISCGGVTGVSNSLVSALWGVDYLFTAIEQGADGINFHGGVDGSCYGYSPICAANGKLRPQPLYVAMLLFHYLAQGRVVPVQVSRQANITAHAVLADDRTLRVVLINKDLKNSATVQLSAENYRRASLLRLRGSAPDATTGITLGGSAVAEDGSWSPAPSESVTQSDRNFWVSLPSASAAAVTLMP